MPIANTADSPIESPAPSANPTSASSSPTSDGQLEEQIATNHDYTLNNKLDEQIAPDCSIVSIDEDWEEIEL